METYYLKTHSFGNRYPEWILNLLSDRSWMFIFLPQAHSFWPANQPVVLFASEGLEFASERLKFALETFQVYLSISFY